ncbi:hypothetical protein UA08_08244 [Talaromyces atroroseus]|uniref:BZIP domain-containing protein n=1 Tax=Talaromyces atroroseus TaxID=1441469 RepID=A0A225AHG7_TALAT|nr:hypothetical protein UA08_08244 [Talaromyces atroroseus]OKL56498.1 hypothetical protein UA08_08244 [Talaromyces atroroseus]
MSPEFPPSFDIHVNKQQHVKKEEDEDVDEETNRVPEGKDTQTRESDRTGSKRQYPWPEPVAVSVFQPRLESHARSNRVHSILNPTPEGGDSQETKRPAHDTSNSSSNNNNNNSNNMSSTEILPPPPTLPPSPQRRCSSSPLLAPISKSSHTKSYHHHLHHAGRSSVSPPHNPPRRIITPVSPAMRYASAGGNNIANAGSAGVSGSGGSGAEAKVRVSQSPFVPLSELSAGVYSTPGGSGPGPTTPIEPPSLMTTPRFSPKLAIPIPSRNASLPPAPLQVSRHSTPTLIHSCHPSGGLANNPSSQASSPSTPQSTFSSFAQSSPSVASGLLPPLGQLSAARESPSQSPFMGMEPLSRTPSRTSMSTSRYGDDHHPHHQPQHQHPAPFPGPPDHPHQQQPPPPPYHTMIPVTIDLKSGSRSQAEKRKANSDASRRFRNRKKNEAALEQKISQLTEQLQCAIEERDYYRSERDFFRDTLGRNVDISQMPSRPASPSSTRRFHQTSIAPAGGEDMSKSASTGTTSSSLASTPHILPSPVSGPESLSSSAAAAAGQHQHQHHLRSSASTYPPADSWQGGGGGGEYHHAYRDDSRFANPRRS